MKKQILVSIVVTTGKSHGNHSPLAITRKMNHMSGHLAKLPLKKTGLQGKKLSGKSL